MGIFYKLFLENSHKGYSLRKILPNLTHKILTL